jgi:hypothetical protein
MLEDYVFLTSRPFPHVVLISQPEQSFQIFFAASQTMTTFSGFHHGSANPRFELEPAVFDSLVRKQIL